MPTINLLAITYLCLLSSCLALPITPITTFSTRTPIPEASRIEVTKPIEPFLGYRSRDIYTKSAEEVDREAASSLDTRYIQYDEHTKKVDVEAATSLLPRDIQQPDEHTEVDVEGPTSLSTRDIPSEENAEEATESSSLLTRDIPSNDHAGAAIEPPSASIQRRFNPTDTRTRKGSGIRYLGGGGRDMNICGPGCQRKASVR